MCPIAKVTISSLSSQVMPPRAKGKNKATNAGLPSSRLRERTFTKYDEELADEEDGEEQLFKQLSADESSDAGLEALAAPLATAGRGRGRGRARGKAGAPAAAHATRSRRSPPSSHAAAPVHPQAAPWGRRRRRVAAAGRPRGAGAAAGCQVRLRGALEPRARPPGWPRRARRHVCVCVPTHVSRVPGRAVYSYHVEFFHGSFGPLGRVITACAHIRLYTASSRPHVSSRPARPPRVEVASPAPRARQMSRLPSTVTA